ncbi:MAG: DUF1127 domain-containing protein [Alphaproteobacteria bacterium]|jgi:uncharacterized protein YjiS (DUF1127 family)|nr:DUF1127 domain-containing protein [Alphaproteobacteria bacterium]
MYKQNVYSTGWMASYTPADQDLSLGQPGVGAFLAQAAVRLALGVAGWMEKRRIQGELMAMDDRELADIGLVRTDIERVADGRFVAERSHPKVGSLPREKAPSLPRLAA